MDFFLIVDRGGSLWSVADCSNYALLPSKNSAEEHLQSILEFTRGIIFLGTPHSGSGLAELAGSLAKKVGLIKQTNAKILEILRRDSEVLARIQTEFHTMLKSAT